MSENGLQEETVSRFSITYATNQYLDLCKRLGQVAKEREVIDCEEEVLKVQIEAVESSGLVDPYFLARGKFIGG